MEGSQEVKGASKKMGEVPKACAGEAWEAGAHLALGTQSIPVLRKCREAEHQGRGEAMWRQPRGRDPEVRQSWGGKELLGLSD